MDLNQRSPRLDPSRFSMVPRNDVPRSTFVTTHNHKLTFGTGWLIPFHVDEVLPGDVHQGEVTVFARLATPVFPIMDQMTLETFFFFVPCRLVWANWRKMMGERDNPSDSISYTVPVIDAQGQGPCTIYDYFGIPVNGQTVGGQTIYVNAMPFRAYNFIWNEWFRDQNLQTQIAFGTGDGPDPSGNYTLKRRNKRPDYFTTALPWPLKGGVDVTTGLAGFARVMGLGSVNVGANVGTNQTVRETSGVNTNYTNFKVSNAAGPENAIYMKWNIGTGYPEVFADLSSATGVTINALRLAFQTQQLLERDARSGTRYTELLRAHFGVTPEDTRLQRPEYIGGGRANIQTSAIPQTSATGLTGGTSPLGALGGAATASDRHSFSYHATEHGYIIGLVHATGEVTYQQGLHRMWTRQTRYDFYWPAFANLGEQAIRSDELYCDGNDGPDTGVFGYQERWAEYRHRSSRVSGLFRSTSTGTIDPWHLAQRFGSRPALNSTFLEDNPPLSRALTAGAAADNMQILMDSMFRIRSTRPMPMYSVPGMVDRF